MSLLCFRREVRSDVTVMLLRYFGRDIYSALSGTGPRGSNIPVGLIATDVGGTPDQHWSSQDALDKCKGDNPWQWDANFTDSVLWNAMVVPLLRTVHSGVIWCESSLCSSPPPNIYCLLFVSQHSDFLPP
jgi:hypothetical protein